MAEHALLSASSSHRWLQCQPSARLEESFENETSPAAEEGSAAHAMAEHKLRKFLKLKTKKPTGSKEMEFYTDAYVNYACELISEAYTRSSDAQVLVEQRLDYSHYADSGFGTGDLVIVSDGILDLVDLKYGIGCKDAFKREGNGSEVSQSVIKDIDVRLTELQQELMNLVQKTGVYKKEYTTIAAEIEILRDKRQGLKDAVSEMAWGDKQGENFNVYLVAQDSQLDKFDGNLFRKLVEKVKVQSMVEVVFVLKGGVEMQEILR
jgi:hypothetical protein